MRYNFAYLRDLFSTINNRVNGFEHVLARRPKVFRPTAQNFSPTINRWTGAPHAHAQANARRRRQMGVS
jgi:hypothetical protein